METRTVELKSLIFRPLARWVIAQRVAVIVGVLAITALLASRIGTLGFDTNPELWAPQKHAYVETTHLLEQTFGGTNLTVIGVVPKNGDVYQPEVLAKIQRIQAAIEEIPHAVRHNVLSFAARKVKSIRGGPDGMEVHPLMEAIPRTPEEIENLKAAVASMPIYVNALVSPDG